MHCILHPWISNASCGTLRPKLIEVLEADVIHFRNWCSRLGFTLPSSNCQDCRIVINFPLWWFRCSIFSNFLPISLSMTMSTTYNPRLLEGLPKASSEAPLEAPPPTLLVDIVASMFPNVLFYFLIPKCLIQPPFYLCLLLITDLVIHFEMMFWLRNYMHSKIVLFPYNVKSYSVKS